MVDQSTIESFRSLGWIMSLTGRYWIKDSPTDDDIYWFAQWRNDGWYWYEETFKGQRTNENGPFNTWADAAEACEVAHIGPRE